MPKRFKSERSGARKARSEASNAPLEQASLSPEDSLASDTSDISNMPPAASTEPNPKTLQALGGLIRKSGLRLHPQSPGEPWESFKKRTLGGVLGLMGKVAEQPSQSLAVPVSGAIPPVVQGWLSAGHPDSMDIDSKALEQGNPGAPGAIRRLFPGEDGNWQMEPFSPSSPELPPGSIFLVQHGSEGPSEAQGARARIIGHARSGDFGRARAEALKASKSGQLSDDEISSALDEAFPKNLDPSTLSSKHLLALAGLGNPEQKKQLLPHLAERFEDSAQLSPELNEHLASLYS